MKSKTLLIVMLSLMLVNVLSVMNVVADYSEMYATFDESGVNAGMTDVTSTYWSMKSMIGASRQKISADEAHTDTNSMYVHDASDPTNTVMGYWNLTQDYDYIYNFSSWIYFTDTPLNTYQGGFNMLFYNEDNTLVNHFRFIIYNSGGIRLYIQQIDSESNTNHILNAATQAWLYEDWLRLDMVHDSGNQMKYTLYNTSGEPCYWLNDTCRTATDWESFKYVKFTAYSDEQWMSLYYDDIRIVYGDAPPGASETETTFCTTDGYLTSQAELDDVRFIETEYVPVTGLGLNGNITEVTLPISTTQYNNHGGIDQYDMVINGVNLGNPTSFINYDDPNNPYALYWSGIDVILLDNHPVFSFGCYQKHADKYWSGHAVSTATSRLHYKYGNTDSEHNNSLWDGVETINYDMFFCFTVTQYEIGETPEGNETSPGGTVGDFYFYFYDITTGEPLYFKGTNIAETAMGTLDFIDGLIYSSITTDGMANSYSTTARTTITANFTDGDWIDFYIIDTGFTDFRCRIDYVYTYFKVKEVQLQIYHGQSYAIYLEPIGYSDGVNYDYCGGFDETDGEISVCLTKEEYDFGESVRMQYTLPTGKWLLDNGWLTTGWRFAFYNRDDYFLGVRWNDWDYIHTQTLTSSDFDGNRHTYDFDIEEYNDFGYDLFYNDYEICIINFNAGWFDNKQMFYGLIFYCTGDDFVPTGEITSITPNPAYFGQPVDIAWTSNGAGRIEINYPSGDTYFSTPYLYSDSVHTLTKTMTGIGTFSVEVYTYSTLIGNTTLPVDTDTLIVNPLGGNGTFGSFGYGVPYLYIPNYRGIAGYDTIQIYYRTYKNDSRLNITSPRGEITYFSTTVSNESDNVLNIEIPNYMQIGNWNVTLDGGDIYGNDETLRTSFNVVNEENNWIEFSKNIFDDNDHFSVYIKHSYRVSLMFYKDDILQGENIILQVGEEDNTLFVIDKQNIQPSVGNWRVEMWRINDRNVVYQLAEWECIVITSPIDLSVGDTEVYGLDLLGMILSLPLVIRYTLGMIVTILITILPYLLMLLASKKSRLTTVNLPSVIYLGTLMFGETISVLCGFFDWAVPAITLIAIVLGFMIYWLKNKSGEGGEA